MKKKIENGLEKEQYKSEHKIHYDTADENDKLIINLRDINRIMRILYEGRESQKRILMILMEAAPITQRSLTERLGIQPGSASEVLAKLERGGLIARTESADDRRTTDITLTDQGQLLAEEALNQRRTRHKEMFSCLTEDEKRVLLTLLEKVNADWQERYQSAGEHSCRRHGHGKGHGHEHRCNADNNHGHGRDIDHGPEPDIDHDHRRDIDHGPGPDIDHDHRHDIDHGPGSDIGHDHSHRFDTDHSHEPDTDYGHGRPDIVHDGGSDTGYESEHFRRQDSKRGSCNGNCRECEHPCKRRNEHKEFHEGHDNGSHHHE